MALFWKELHDTTVVNTTIQNFTTAGATFAEVISQPGNSSAVGKVKGAEFGYRQTYDFLPGVLSGLGIDTNYTLLTSDGVPQSVLNETSANVGANVLPTVNLSRLPLQGLSKQTFNAAGIYDKGPFSARLAWEWRSRFLLTTRDVIVPYAPIMSENHGQLSASAFYSITPHIKLGFEGANLTDSITRTTQVLNNDLFRVPRAWFISDRRYSAVLRCTF
jgi:TonB-dependent receptor